MKKKQALLYASSPGQDEDIIKALEPYFEFTQVYDHESFINDAALPKYGLIIIHTQEACDQTLEYIQHATCDGIESFPAVVVVSKHQSSETIKKAYDSGAVDYYCEPLNLPVFTQNMLRLHTHLETIQEVHDKHQKSRSVTETALGQAAFYGSGLEIIASLNQVESEETIARQVLNSLAQAGVYAAIQLRNGEQTYEFDENKTTCDENIVKTFHVLKDHGRIYRFGRRLMINDQHVSILIKYVEGDSQAIHDNILDVGAKLVPAIDLRYQNILQNRALKVAQSSMDHCISELRQGVNRVRDSNLTLLSNVTAQVQMSFHQLELNETQERFFIDLLENEIGKLDNTDEFATLNSLLQNILDQLNASVVESPAAEEATEDYQDLEFF